MAKKGGKKNKEAPIELKETESQQLERLRALSQSRYKTKSWFYLAVGALATVIAALWGYSMYGRLTNFEIKKAPESELITENKKTWKEIFETVGGENQSGEIKAKLQEVLSELKKAAEQQAATTTPTTNATSTPAINTATTNN